MARRDDGGWFDPNDDAGIWEHQGDGLTVADLARIVAEAPADLPVELAHYDGTGRVKSYRVVHVDLRGHDGVAESVLVTIAPLG